MNYEDGGAKWLRFGFFFPFILRHYCSLFNLFYKTFTTVDWMNVVAFGGKPQYCYVMSILLDLFAYDKTICYLFLNFLPLPVGKPVQAYVSIPAIYE